MDRLRQQIRDIPDFPKPGIVFKDISPLLGDPQAFALAIAKMAEAVGEVKIDKIVAIESRGFIFGAPLAYKLGAGLVMVRKPHKLPYRTARIEYALEYGNDCLEVHVDALERGERVLIVDDVLATGGTALATAGLMEKVGARVEGLVFLAELAFLKGRDKLKGYKIISLVSL